MDNGTGLSLLPEDLILRIISFLPLTDAMVLCMALATTKHLWTHCRFIELGELWFTEVPMRRQLLSVGDIVQANALKTFGRRRFNYFADRILRCLVSPSIVKFSLRVCYEPEFYILIGNWISLAISKNVEELILDFSDGDPLRYMHSFVDPLITLPEFLPITLPKFLYDHGRSIHKLSFNTCRLGPFDFHSYESLTDISLVQVELAMAEVVNLLTNCLCLQVLTLVDCYDLIKLEISSPGLRLERLVIRNCYPLTVGIELCAPRLKYFEYSGRLASFNISSLISIEEVILDFMRDTDSPYESKVLIDLLWSFSSVKTLRLCSHAFKVVPSDIDLFKDNEPPLHMVNLEHLTLVTSLGDNELPGICYLLGSLPNLKTLYIVTGFFRLENCDCNMSSPFFSPAQWMARLPFFHLQTIHMDGFSGTTNEMDLLKFLLRCARFLDTLIITPRPDGSSYWARRVAQSLWDGQISSRWLNIEYH